MNDLVSLWNDPKYTNIIKLILWFIFIIFVFCLALFSNRNKVINKENIPIENNNILKIHNKSVNIKYQIDDYKIDGNYSDKIFKGTVIYQDGTTYQIKYENDSLVKDDNNGDFLVISIETRYLDPNYISELFNSSKPTILEENKSYLYNIDGTTYYVYINENNSYKIRIIKNDKEGILEYQYLE